VTLTADPVSANRSEVHLIGELSKDGIFTGRYTTSQHGTQQYRLRGALSAEFTADERRQMARGIASEVFRGASADSLELFDGRDLRATPRISVWISGGLAARRTGDQMILTLPLQNFANASLVTELENQPARRFPIDVAQVLGPVELVAELRLRLPEGWRARLPDAVSAESEFGRYHAEYRQEGRELVVLRRMAGRTGVEPPTKIGALVDWLRAVAKDDVTYVVLEQGG
jgi:hypothetical protein